jgi:hypothetical protein
LKNKYPRGKLNEDDEGELQFAIGADTKEGVVIISFGKNVSWLGMPPELARDLARLLNQKADEVDKVKQ